MVRFIALVIRAGLAEVSWKATIPEREDKVPKFKTKVELGGKTATGFEVPTDIVAGLGSHKRPAVVVTINGYSYRSTVATMGGRFLLPLSAENRNGAGVAAGDEIEVELALDTAPREVEVPPDYAAALDTDPALRRRFDALAFTQRKEQVRSIEDAKTDATRERRIQKFLDQLRNSL